MRMLRRLVFGRQRRNQLKILLLTLSASLCGVIFAEMRLRYSIDDSPWAKLEALGGQVEENATGGAQIILMNPLTFSAVQEFYEDTDGDGVLDAIGLFAWLGEWCELYYETLPVDGRLEDTYSIIVGPSEAVRFGYARNDSDGDAMADRVSFIFHPQNTLGVEEMYYDLNGDGLVDLRRRKTTDSNEAYIFWELGWHAVQEWINQKTVLIETPNGNGLTTLHLNESGFQ